MSDDERDQLVYLRYADFLRADPRREGDALGLGADWRDGDALYRVCWYQETGELTLERLSADEEADLEDFHHGVSGRVEALHRLSSRADLEALLGEWPRIAPGEPRDVARLREMVKSDPMPVHAGERRQQHRLGPRPRLPRPGAGCHPSRNGLHALLDPPARGGIRVMRRFSSLDHSHGMERFAWAFSAG